ncbi:hypothetical protein [Vibrio gigantis]|uniref:hypothetical protein n=1 Tax=Vibrio gigantis TaxID=296199 RepID=UPI001BFEB8F7|nr:hypothetical protein [Vibrio gigantis]
MNRLFLLLLVIPSMVAAKLVEVEATGYGVDISAATDDALVAAVKQTNNTTINVNQKSVSTLLKDNGATDLSKATGKTFDLTANGVIKEYKIVSSQCNDDKCSVKILAVVKESKETVIENLKRKKVSIKTFKGKSSDNFNTALEQSFTKGGGKFAVIENAVDEQMDYLIEVTLKKADTKSWKVDSRKTDPLTNRVSGSVTTKYSSIYEVNYRVLSGVTGQVKYASSQKSTSSRNNLSLLAKITASKVYEDITDAVFPMRIAAVSPEVNEIAIPTDGKTFSIGQKLKITAVGNKVRDPYTKEVIGYQTIKVGEAKVSRIDRKVMYATITSSNIDSIQTKMIVEVIKSKRKVDKKVTQPKIKPTEDKAESIVDSKHGGVVL